MADRAVNLETVIGMVNTYFRNVINLNPDLLIDGIVSLPTVDAVPVVRCEDCRFWSKYPGSSAAPQYHECMARMTYIGNMYTTAWEYCSRGERKDGDNE